MLLVIRIANDVIIELYHGDFLINGPPWKYENGTIDIVIHIDLDKLSYWELLDIMVELGCPSNFEIYHKLPNKQEKDDLVFIDDRQVIKMIKAYKGEK